MANLALIKKLIVTEKASMLAEQGKYIFLVRPEATKNEIKKAVAEMYKVDPVGVTTIVQKPRRTRYRGRPSYKRQDKKAVVTLKKGQKIEG